LDAITHVDNSMVASALGSQGLIPFDSPSASSLVQGGADSFRATTAQERQALEARRTVA